MNVTEIPVFINCRDRVSDLRVMVGWLERAGMQSITLLDNASTYPPLLDFYASQPASRVRYLGENYGHMAIMLAGLQPTTPYIYSDPDLVPLGPPREGVERLWELHERYPFVFKIGFGLTLEGVPPDLPSLNWEMSLQAEPRLLEPGVYKSPIDTTFALWIPGVDGSFENALRTGAPHVMRHSSWYTDSNHLSEEDQYYLDHVEGTASSWATGLGIQRPAVRHHGHSWT